MLRRCIYNIPVFIVYLLLCASVFFLDGHSAGDRIWDSYYTIAVPEGSAEQIIENNTFGDASVVSAYNTVFRFNDFSSMAEVSLPDVQKRFVDGDPRIDPFIRGAADYFSTVDAAGNRWELLYVGSNRSAWDFYFEARKAAGEESHNWIFPDFSVGDRAAAAVLFLLCLIFGVFISGGLRLPVAAAGLPWLISTAVTGTAMLPASCSVYLFSVLFIRESYFDILYRLNYGKKRFSTANYLFAAGLGVSAAAAIVTNAIRGLPVLPLFLSAVAGFASVCIFYSLKGQRVRMQEHRLFFPVSLKHKSHSAPAHNKLPEMAAAAAAIIIIPMFSLFFSQTLPVEVPVPQHPAEQFSPWSWESLDYIDKSDEGLVNAADLLRHAAFQDGFMYGRKWSFPKPDEGIILKRYVSGNNEILCEEVNIRLFTDKWYSSIINAELSTGLNALLLSQDAPGGIICKADISSAVGSFNPVRHVLICILALLPLTGHLKNRVSITVRRKGQEA